MTDPTPRTLRDEIADWMASRDNEWDRVSRTAYLEEADALLASFDIRPHNEPAADERILRKLLGVDVDPYDAPYVSLAAEWLVVDGGVGLTDDEVARCRELGVVAGPPDSIEGADVSDNEIAARDVGGDSPTEG